MKKNFNSFKLQRELTHRLDYNRKTAIRSALSISIALSFIVMFSLGYTFYDKKNGISILDFVSVKLLVNFLLNIVFIYYLFFFQFKIIRRLSFNKSKLYPILFFLSFFIIVVLVSPIISRAQWRWFFSESLPSGFFIALHLAKDLMILFLSFLYTSLIFLFNKNQEKELENNNLEIENLQNRYNMLKNQVDPHFLFNSLNTLNGLISSNVTSAHNYLSQLSHTLRYTMQEHQIVTLREELEFVESYISLMKIRYGDALNIDLNINSAYLTYKILPFGLQILIENAIKHNVLSQKYPLFISVRTSEDETISVENNIKYKRNRGKNNGLGLANLNERYWLMFNKNITVVHQQDKFVVEVPLISTKNLGQ